MKQDVYQKEAQQKWGKTDEFKECQGKTAQYSQNDWDKIHAEAKLITDKLAENIDRNIADAQVQDLVNDWRNHITKYYYNCTNEIFRGLGKMYVTDERFKKHYEDIQPGLAQFFSNAIKYYCDNK